MTFITGPGEVLPLLIGGFLAAALIALILTPLIRTLVRRRGIVDAPNHRRGKTRPIPGGGGRGVGGAFLAVAGGAAVVAVTLDPRVPVGRGAGCPGCGSLVEAVAVAAGVRPAVPAGWMI